MSAPDPRRLREDPAFEALKALIVAETGHHYYEGKEDQLAERLARRMAALGVAAPDRYLERLRDPVAGPREWRRLEAELTIKETFFFRFAEQFEALRTRILPGLIAARAGTKRLRIWSAGCSTGPEPYSLAVLVHDLLGAAVADWRVSILGTDIDETALAHAREAHYGEWSLRVTRGPERQRLFEPDGKRFRLRQPWRSMVRFERLNLLDLATPAAPLQLRGHDLILCRNLLIYFRPEIATGLVATLGDHLAADGWLLLGHAEAGLAVGSGLVAGSIGGIVGYRLPVAADVAAAPSPPAVAPPRPSLPSGTRRARRAAPRPPDIPVMEEELAVIRHMLSTGAAEAARARIAAAHERGLEAPLLRYFDALGAAALGDAAAAERALRAALYLDGGFAMAHYMLGLRLIAGRRERDGRRALANAADALDRLDGGAPVPEGDGLTAADLRAAIRHRLAREMSA